MLVDDQTQPSPAVKRAVKALLRDALTPFGFRDARVVAGEDHDGDPVLYIETDFAFSDRPIDSRVFLQTQVDLMRKLRTLGETRFPHLRHNFAEGQPVRGF